MSLKISHPCVQAEKVLTQQPSCCINCTMNFQVSTSKGRIINHDLSKILKTKHPSQSKQCILAGLEREWRSVSKQILNCFSLLHWHWAGGHAMMVSLDTISQQQEKSSPLSTSATWGAFPKHLSCSGKVSANPVSTQVSHCWVQGWAARQGGSHSSRVSSGCFILYCSVTASLTNVRLSRVHVLGVDFWLHLSDFYLKWQQFFQVT